MPLEQLITDGILFLLKTFTIYLVAAKTYKQLGLGIAAIAAQPALNLLAKDKYIASLLAPPKNSLDLAVLYGIVPMLCMPALMLNGFGAAVLIFLYAHFCWRRLDTTSLSTVLLMVPVYSFASAFGCFVPRLTLVEGTILISTTAAGHALPTRLLAFMLPLMLAISPNARLIVAGYGPEVLNSSISLVKNTAWGCRHFTSQVYACMQALVAPISAIGKLAFDLFVDCVRFVVRNTHHVVDTICVIIPLLTNYVYCGLEFIGKAASSLAAMITTSLNECKADDSSGSPLRSLLRSNVGDAAEAPT